MYILVGIKSHPPISTKRVRSIDRTLFSWSSSNPVSSQLHKDQICRIINTAPLPAYTIAGSSRQRLRARPKGLADAALCGPIPESTKKEIPGHTKKSVPAHPKRESAVNILPWRFKDIRHAFPPAISCRKACHPATGALHAIQTRFPAEHMTHSLEGCGPIFCPHSPIQPRTTSPTKST